MQYEIRDARFIARLVRWIARMIFPHMVVAFLGGYAFGFIAGGVLALLATVTGCALTFYYARGMGRR